MAMYSYGENQTKLILKTSITQDQLNCASISGALLDCFYCINKNFYFLV